MRCGLIEISKEPHSPPNVTMVFGGDSEDDDDDDDDECGIGAYYNNAYDQN